jgi:hypothetical protein
MLTNRTKKIFFKKIEQRQLLGCAGGPEARLLSFMAGELSDF